MGRGMRNAFGSPDRMKSVRIGFVFDMDALVTINTEGALVARDGVADVISYFYGNNIAYVVFHNGVKVTERDMARLLNDALAPCPPMDFPNMVLPTSPLCGLLDAKNTIVERTVLVLGGSGEDARRLAHENGYPWVITSSDVARYYDNFKKYHNPANDAPPDLPQGDRSPWRLKRSKKHLRIEGILVFWEPEDRELDVELTLYLIMNCGRLGYDCTEDNAKLTQEDLVDKIQRNMPPVHMCTVDRPAPSPEGVPAQTFLQLLQFRWLTKSATLGRIDLKLTLYGGPPDERLFRCIDRSLGQADKPLYAIQKGLDARDDGLHVPPVRSVYTVGVPKFQPHTGARWKDILLEGQVIPPGKPPSFVAKDVKSAVEHGLVEGYWSAVDAGLKPMWPTPMEPRPEGMVPLEIKGGEETKKGWCKQAKDVLKAWFGCCGFFGR